VDVADGPLAPLESQFQVSCFCFSLSNLLCAPRLAAIHADRTGTSTHTAVSVLLRVASDQALRLLGIRAVASASGTCMAMIKCADPCPFLYDANLW
jgi:hypothetical protein